MPGFIFGRIGRSERGKRSGFSEADGGEASPEFFLLGVIGLVPEPFEGMFI
jgi:hypothetical protein